MRLGAPFPWAISGLVVSAWLTLWLWGASPYASYLGHETATAGTAPVVASVVFLLGWALMIAAMMLPTVTGLLRSFAQVVRQRPDGRRLELLVIAGFFGVWIAVGFAFRAFDGGVHAAVAAIAWLDDRPQLVGAAALVAAGAFQFSSLKHRCLTACRSPRGFIFRHWRGAQPRADAVRIGMTYGASCAGCCWALMLLLFALGTAGLAWMLAVGAVMALERNTAIGVRLSRPVGAGLIAAGLLVAVA